VTNSLPVPARSINAVFTQLSRRHGSSENGAVAANAVRTNAARRPAGKPWPTTSPTTSTAGILRPLSDKEEVPADPLGGGRKEGRGKLQAGTLGQLGRRQRIPDRTQILQLVLGHIKTRTQRDDLMVAHVGLFAKARDQRLLALLSLTQIADVAVSGISFGVQPP
jgi:hypothetical protein